MVAGNGILGIGTDIVELERIAELLENQGPRFLERCFRPDEVGRNGDDIDHLRIAEAWAAKEAFLKALGTRVRQVPYRDIEVVVSGGIAGLRLHGCAAEVLAGVGGCRTLLSSSHSRSQAVALVVLCG